MAADALAPSVARPSAAIVLIMQGDYDNFSFGHGQYVQFVYNFALCATFQGPARRGGASRRLPFCAGAIDRRQGSCGDEPTQPDGPTARLLLPPESFASRGGQTRAVISATPTD